MIEYARTPQLGIYVEGSHVAVLVTYKESLYCKPRLQPLLCGSDVRAVQEGVPAPRPLRLYAKGSCTHPHCRACIKAS